VKAWNAPVEIDPLDPSMAVLVSTVIKPESWSNLMCLAYPSLADHLHSTTSISTIDSHLLENAMIFSNVF
jgi:hypothetical protein